MLQSEKSLLTVVNPIELHLKLKQKTSDTFYTEIFSGWPWSRVQRI